LGKYVKKGHREFFVPGNVILQKRPKSVVKTVQNLVEFCWWLPN